MDWELRERCDCPSGVGFDSVLDKFGVFRNLSSSAVEKLLPEMSLTIEAEVCLFCRMSIVKAFLLYQPLMTFLHKAKEIYI